MTLDGADVGGIGIHDEPGPTVVDGQESRVRLAVVLDAELHEDPPRNRDVVDQELDDAVLATLRVDTELLTRQTGLWRDQLARLQPADRLSEPVQLVVRLHLLERTAQPPPASSDLQS